MKPKYVLFYTLFGFKYNGFKSSYKFFEDEDSMYRFMRLKNISFGDCIIFENIDEV